MKKLPIGIDSFANLIRGDGQTEYWYVDKTLLVREILLKGKKVNLIPRPRGFGKSLNLDMIRQFVSVDGDPALFDGLKIAEDREFCQHYQCKYPVLYFNFKGIEGSNFDEACALISGQISTSMGRDYAFLQDSAALTTAERKNCAMYAERELWPGKNGREGLSMPSSVLASCLSNLCLYLEKHYRHKVAVFLDEYDVPLSSAWSGGYYDEMARLIRNMFVNLLKGNKSLGFAVLTGCLRVSGESIFTGLNNLRVWSSGSDFSADYFGFTETEVKAMLEYYGLSETCEVLKEWYDGFRFGHEYLYCPWDVIGSVDQCGMKKEQQSRNCTG